MKKTLKVIAIALVIGIIAGATGGYMLKRSLDMRKAASYFSYGREMYDQKKYPEAIKNLNRAIALSPAFTSAHMLLAGSYQSQGWNELAQKELKAGGAPPERPVQ